MADTFVIVEYFLKVDGIEGGSVDSAHKGEFEIESFSFGVENPTTIGSATGGAGAGKIKFNEFHVMKSTDKASPTFFLKCATGQHIKDATLTARKAGENPQEFLKIRMSDVLVSTYAIAGARPAPTPPPPPVDVIAVVGDVTTAGDIIGPELPTDALGLTFKSVQVTGSQPARVSVPPAIGGVLTFDAASGKFEILDSPNGVMSVGTNGGTVSRGVQEFDISDLIGLLRGGFGKLTLTVNEVRPVRPPTDGGGQIFEGAEPHLHFDVISYAPADGFLTSDDLTRKGDRIGTLTVDPRGAPASGEFNFDTEMFHVDTEMLGIRLQLRGAPVHMPPADEGPEEEGPEEHRNATASFTLGLVFATS